MLLNLSNHPSSTWPENQKKAATEKYEFIEDLAFPQIDPKADEDVIEKLAEEFELKIRKKDPTAVHIMGEMTFTYRLVNRLKSIGILCIASTTNRKVSEKNGVKTSVFEFVRFRSY